MDPLSGWYHSTIDLLKTWEIENQATTTIALIVLFFVFRWASIVAIRRWNAPSPEEKRRWIIQVKNLSVVILVAGMFGIWASELRAFAISFALVASAIAIATKDVILCFLGGVYKA